MGQIIFFALSKPMSKPAKETVIIVHGTWAAPDLAKRKWYQPVDSRSGEELFTAKLDGALRQRGSLARCWAHCTNGNSIFQWSGENSWTARTHAAAALGVTAKTAIDLGNTRRNV